MFMQWLWMAGHHCTVLVSGITPGWPLSYFSTMQTSTPKQKASWPLCILLLGTETAGTPWNSSWWIATSNQGWRTTHKKLLLISPGGQASITTSLKSWKAVQTLHLRLNGSSDFLKLQSTSASYVWDVKYPIYREQMSHYRNFVVCITVFFQVTCLTLMSNVFERCLDASVVNDAELVIFIRDNFSWTWVIQKQRIFFWCWSKRKVFLNIPYPRSLFSV